MENGNSAKLFKEGDTVKVKPKQFFLEHNKCHNGEGSEIEYGHRFVHRMWKYCGEKVTIEEVFDDFYSIKESCYSWNDWMLEKLVDDKGNFLLEL